MWGADKSASVATWLEPPSKHFEVRERPHASLWLIVRPGFPYQQVTAARVCWWMECMKSRAREKQKTRSFIDKRLFILLRSVVIRISWAPHRLEAAPHDLDEKFIEWRAKISASEVNSHRVILCDNCGRSEIEVDRRILPVDESTQHAVDVSLGERKTFFFWFFIISFQFIWRFPRFLCFNGINNESFPFWFKNTFDVNVLCSPSLNNNFTSSSEFWVWIESDISNDARSSLQATGSGERRGGPATQAPRHRRRLGLVGGVRQFLHSHRQWVSEA